MLSDNVKNSSVQHKNESGMIVPDLDPEAIHNETDLLAAAIHIDRYLMHAMNRLDKDFTEINTLATLTFKQLNSNKHKLNDKVMIDKLMPSEDVTSVLEKLTVYSEQVEKKAGTPISRLQALCESCDRSIAFYAGIVDTATDAAVSLMAKDLLSSALDRIRILKQALGEECGCIGSAV